MSIIYIFHNRYRLMVVVCFLSFMQVLKYFVWQRNRKWSLRRVVLHRDVSVMRTSQAIGQSIICPFTGQFVAYIFSHCSLKVLFIFFCFILKDII